MNVIDRDVAIVKATLTMPNDGIVQSRGGIGIFHSIDSHQQSYTNSNNAIGLGEDLFYNTIDKSLQLMPNWMRGEFTDMNTGWKDIIGTTIDVFPANPAMCGTCRAEVTEWGGDRAVAMKMETVNKMDANRTLVFTQFNSPIQIGNKSHSISSFIPTTGAMRDTYVVGDTPSAIAFDSTHNHLWIANSESDDVIKLNAATGVQIGSRIDVGAFPVAMAFDSSHTYLWVVNRLGNSVTKIRTTDGVVMGTYKVGFRPSAILCDTSRNTVWITNYGDNTVTRLNATTGAAVDSALATGYKPSAVAITSDQVWVTNSASNNITRFYAANGTLVSTTPLVTGRGPSALALDVAQSIMWVTNYTDNTVSRFSSVTGAVVGTALAVGMNPSAICFDTVRHYALVANKGGDNFSVIPTTNPYVMATYAAYANPSAIIFDGTQGVYWLNNAPSKAATLIQIDFGIQVDAQGVDIPHSGYRLEWKADSSPIFYKPGDPVTGERKALSRRSITMDELESYCKGGSVQWSFMPVQNGEMIILCTALSDRWLVTGLNNTNNTATPLGIPEGKISIMADGVNSSVNMTATTYPEYGICKTDWIALNDYNIIADAIEEFKAMPYPYFAKRNSQKEGNIYFGIGETELIPPAEATSPPYIIRNRIKIWILIKSGNYDPVKGYGTSTPLLRGWQLLVPPIYSEPSTFIPEMEITEFVKDCNITLNIDAAADTATLALENGRNWKDFAIDGTITTSDVSLLDGILINGFPLNYMCCEVEYGYRKVYEINIPGLEELDTRYFKGTIPAGNWSANLGQDKFDITIQSPAHICQQSQLYNAPCLMGFAIDEAIATIALWTGIPGSKIFIHTSESEYAIWKQQSAGTDMFGRPLITTPTMDWTYLGDGAPVNYYLTGDEFSMESPTWLCNQQKGWEVMARIADKFGFYMYFYRDELHIQRIQDLYPVVYTNGAPTPNIGISFDGVGDEEYIYHLHECGVAPASSDPCNMVIVEGKDSNGNPIMACDIDYDSVDDTTDENYVGYRLSSRLIDSEVNNQIDLNTVTRIYMSTHRPGKKSMTGAATFKNGWILKPGMVFKLHTFNVVSDAYIFRIKTVSLSSGIEPIWHINITAEDIDTQTPHAFSMIGSKSAFRAIESLIEAKRPLSAHLQSPDNSGNAVFLRNAKNYSNYTFGGLGEMWSPMGGSDVLGHIDK